MSYTVQFGNSTIQYELSFADRKTMAIDVHPDLRVTVKAPLGSELAAVESRVRKRASWILKQLREFETYLPHLPPRQYVSGETIAISAGSTVSNYTRPTRNRSN